MLPGTSHPEGDQSAVAAREDPVRHLVDGFYSTRESPEVMPLRELQSAPPRQASAKAAPSRWHALQAAGVALPTVRAPHRRSPSSTVPTAMPGRTALRDYDGSGFVRPGNRCIRRPVEAARVDDDAADRCRDRRRAPPRQHGGRRRAAEDRRRHGVLLDDQRQAAARRGAAADARTSTAFSFGLPIVSANTSCVLSLTSRATASDPGCGYLDSYCARCGVRP